MGEIITAGSIWAALPLALLAGLVSFASPCVLPLVPGYLGYLTGTTTTAAAGCCYFSSRRTKGSSTSST